MGTWWSIEVIDGKSSAESWQDAHGDAIVESALAEQADDWAWHHNRWGVVLEVSLADEAWERFLASPAVRAALDAVPNPLTGLIVYRGRGGNAGSGAAPRRRPLLGSGAASLPLPTPEVEDRWRDSIVPLRLTLS